MPGFVILIVKDPATMSSFLPRLIRMEGIRPFGSAIRFVIRPIHALIDKGLTVKEAFGEAPACDFGSVFHFTRSINLIR